MDPGPDIDAVLAILSRADDPDLADIVELVAKICEAEAVGITILRDDDYHVPITYGIMPFVSPSTNTLLPAHDEHRGRLRHRGRALDQSMEYGAAGEEPDLVEVDLGRVAQQLRGTERSISGSRFPTTRSMTRP